jgi:hypothetical protein
MPPVQRSVPGIGTTSKRAAFIGTRRVEEVSDFAHAAYLNLVEKMVGEGYTIRTGAAPGADQLAAARALHLGGTVELVLPWKNYEALWVGCAMASYLEKVWVEVYDPYTHIAWGDSVHRYHPAVGKLNIRSFSLHARNYGIIEPCELVVALPAPDRQGGTEQGIRIAEALEKRRIILESPRRGGSGRMVPSEDAPDPAGVAGWIPFQLDCTVVAQ